MLVIKSSFQVISGVKGRVRRLKKSFIGTFGDKYERMVKREDKYFEKTQSRKHFFIQKDGPIYAVYDDDEEIVYTFKRKPNLRKRSKLLFSVYDAENNAVASIIDADNIKNKVLVSSRIERYIIEDKDKNRFVLSRYKSSQGLFYEVEALEWKIEESHFGREYTIKRDEKNLFHIVMGRGYDKETYFVDYDEKDNIITGLSTFIMLIDR